jgi:hypothetical protein
MTFFAVLYDDPIAKQFGLENKFPFSEYKYEKMLLISVCDQLHNTNDFLKKCFLISVKQVLICWFLSFTYRPDPNDF